MIHVQKHYPTHTQQMIVRSNLRVEHISCEEEIVLALHLPAMIDDHILVGNTSYKPASFGFCFLVSHPKFVVLCCTIVHYNLILSKAGTN